MEIVVANNGIVWDCQPRRFALRLPAPHASRYAPRRRNNVRVLIVCFSILFSGFANAATQYADWVLDESKDEFTDNRVLTARTIAVGTESKWGKPQYLVARCKDGKLSLILNWGEFITSEVRRSAYIEVRIDKNEPRKYSYSISNDHSATFIGEPETPSPGISPYYQLIDEMEAGSTVLFRVTPYAENSRVAKFSLRGFTKAYAPVLQCYKDTRKQGR